jgi:hypothetical protein
MPVLLTMEESYPTQFLAMKLNNRAASLLIKQGKYDEGITLLTKASRLTQKGYASAKEPITTSPCCEFCTFHSCLLMGHDTYYSSLLTEHNEDQEAHQRSQYHHHQHNHNQRNTKNELHFMDENESSRSSCSCSCCSCIDFDEKMKCFFESSSLLQESSSCYP